MTKLQQIRKESGYSQSQLAKASGVNVRAIQDYEQAHKPIEGAAAITVYRLAVALGCNMEDLIDTDGEPEAPTADTLNINTATLAELAQLDGLGKKRAACIVSYRETHGSFSAVADLLLVPSIGPDVLRRIKDKIYI
jgi:competence ComEA-like helix-hairpin-helix protein